MMKGIKKMLVVLAFLAGGIGVASAQNYNTAVGLRFGSYGDGAINLKHMLGGSNAIEATLGGGRYHLFLEGLYEWNFDLGSGFNWYLGAGAHAFLWNDNHPVKYYEDGFALGARGVIGIEYTFDFPLNLALHTGPRIGIINGPGYAGWGGSLAIRYAF
ncbi:hypothetical protein [Lishizhenia sp.]|uniref:hypothetical protein n=1 Tax=Lishizhenia sp. TaxID=2497594 RepID=UPI00299D3E60|nr:hypothetical protein [Lishizhenia sp.]MDX1446884.1 hypothetical protein [Lishizhenia sp.]